MDAGERHWGNLGGDGWEVLSNVEKMLEDGWKFIYLLFIYHFLGNNKGKRLGYAKRTFSNLTQLSKFYDQFPNSCNIVTLSISQKN
jgi:hypothetical protein